MDHTRSANLHEAPHAETLEKLSSAIQQIQQHNASRLSFEEHYRYAYNLVLRKQGHLLYNAVAELISLHLEKQTRELIVPVFPPSTSCLVAGGSGSASGGVSSASAAELFLDKLKEVWDDHIACMSKMRDVLKYMDKTYTGSSTIPSVWDLGLTLFFHHVVLYSTDPPPKPPAVTTSSSSRNSAAALAAQAATRRSLQSPTANPNTVAHHLISQLLSIIRTEREGLVVSRHSIKSAVDILLDLTDEQPIPLPVTASVGTGSGTPVLGVGLGGGHGRGMAVMGEGTPGEQESPYKTSFEKPFLEQTKQFYTLESEALLISCDAPTFLKKISRRLEEEATRAQAYLAPSTEPLLIRLIEDTLIAAHLTAILDHTASGLSTLIQDSRIEDLLRLYNLFARVEAGPAALRNAVSAWIIKIGKQANDGLLVEPEVEQDEEEEKIDLKGKGKAGVKGKGKTESSGMVSAKTKAALAWVQNVLDLKDKFDMLLIEAFETDKSMEKAINDAFIVFVNQNPKSPEYISLFVDENLKKGLKGKSEVEVDVVLNKSIALFRFLTEKDQFERYYNSHLARRLIGNRSVSDDAERNMLARFKVEAGAAFTKSAEGMMKDIRTSADAISDYQDSQSALPTSKQLPFEMSTIVCGKNWWPFTGFDTCNLPATLIAGTEAFNAFYNKKHRGRKLTFRSDLGSVEVKVRFTARVHELTVSTHAMVVLSQFEGLRPNETLSYQEISEATAIQEGELRRTLQSLACAKYKVLLKHPKGRDVNDGDTFTFNSGFVCSLAKIKIQTVANKVETAEERKETEGKVDEDRRALCEACIVRVMKDRKQFQYGDLINEVIKQLVGRFRADPKMIKQAVENLINKEYLDRDEKQRTMLRYLA